MDLKEKTAAKVELKVHKVAEHLEICLVPTVGNSIGLNCDDRMYG